IVDRRVPVRVKALARILMLVESRAIESCKPVRVCGEMGRHPVQDDANAGAMRAVDKPGKTLRLAETGRRGVESRRLIAPGRVERMLGDRQELDMGEA